MNPQHITILFYGLIIIGLLLLLVLLFQVVLKSKEIDKSKVTWLIVSFICIVFPVVGNMTLEYGDFKLSLTKLTDGAEEMSIIINDLEEENMQLQERVENLNIQINRYRSDLLNPDVPDNRKAEFLDRVATEFDHIERQSVEVSKSLKNADMKNEVILEGLDKYQRRIK